MKNEIRIHTINTWYGKRYAVVDKVTRFPVRLDKYGKPYNEKVVEYLPIDYKKDNVNVPAIFSHDKEGLEEAKEVQALYRKKK